MARVASETAPSFFAVAGVVAAGLAPSHRVASFSSIELTCSAADIPSLIPVGRDRLSSSPTIGLVTTNQAHASISRSAALSSAYESSRRRHTNPPRFPVVPLLKLGHRNRLRGVSSFRPRLSPPRQGRHFWAVARGCLLYTSPSPRDRTRS